MDNKIRCTINGYEKGLWRKQERDFFLNVITYKNPNYDYVLKLDETKYKAYLEYEYIIELSGEKPTIKEMINYFNEEKKYAQNLLNEKQLTYNYIDKTYNDMRKIRAKLRESKGKQQLISIMLEWKWQIEKQLDEQLDEREINECSTSCKHFDSYKNPLTKTFCENCKNKSLFSEKVKKSESKENKKIKNLVITQKLQTKYSCLTNERKCEDGYRHIAVRIYSDTSDFDNMYEGFDYIYSLNNYLNENLEVEIINNSECVYKDFAEVMFKINKNDLENFYINFNDYIDNYKEIISSQFKDS